MERILSNTTYSGKLHWNSEQRLHFYTNVRVHSLGVGGRTFWNAKFYVLHLIPPAPCYDPLWKYWLFIFKKKWNPPRKFTVPKVAPECLLYLIQWQVLVPKNENLMGKMVTVQIVETGKHFLKGQLLSENGVVQPDVPLPLKKGQVSGVSEQVQVGIQFSYKVFKQWLFMTGNRQHLKIIKGISLESILVF